MLTINSLNPKLFLLQYKILSPMSLDGSKFFMFNKFPVIKLDSGYLLREITNDDAADWLAYMKHPEVAKYVPDPCIPVNVYHAEKEIVWYVNLFHKKTGIAWGISEPKNNRIIGTITIEKWSQYHKRCEIAYDLNPQYWGRGIMRSAIAACLNYAFKKMSVVRIEAFTTLCNEKSVKLLINSGFTHEGILRQHRFFKNQHINVNIFGIINDDYFKHD